MSLSFIPRPWHSSSHSTVRDQVKKHIADLLIAKRPNGDHSWREKVPHMARKLEATLYFCAESLEEHTDPERLLKRLQDLATALGKRRKMAALTQQRNSPVIAIGLAA